MIKKEFKNYGTLVKISSVEGFGEWLYGKTIPLLIEEGKDMDDWAYWSDYERYIQAKKKIEKHVRSLSWFEERIGKRIYRDSNHCNGGKCKDCKMIEDVGIVVADEQHANYLYSIQLEYALDGEFLNYRDEK